MHRVLSDLLIEAQRTLLNTVYVVDRHKMDRWDAEEITARLKLQMARQLAAHIVANQVLNSPDCISMRERYDTDTIEFHARIYTFTPKELERLLTRAFEAGRSLH